MIIDSNYINIEIMKRLLLLITLLFIIRIVLDGQPIPHNDENILN